MDDGWESEQPPEVQFPIWDAVVDLPELDPSECAWIGTQDAVVAVSRVRGVRSDDPDVPLGAQGVTVYSFAPESVVADRYWPAHQTVLGLAQPLALRQGVSIRQASDQLMEMVGWFSHLQGRGGSWTDVELVMDGRPAEGQLLLIAGVGSLVSSVTAPYAFAAACCAIPPVVQFRSWASAARR